MSNNEKLPVLYRTLQDADKAFIFSSWLKNFRNGTMVRNIPNEIYYTNHHKVVEKLMDNAKTIVCCNADDPSIIYGYINYEIVDSQFVLHFVYIKQLYRKLGIAQDLLSATGNDFNKLGCYTHQTMVAVAKEESLNLVYHPYLLFSRGL